MGGKALRNFFQLLFPPRRFHEEASRYLKASAAKIIGRQKARFVGVSVGGRGGRGGRGGKKGRGREQRYLKWSVGKVIGQAREWAMIDSPFTEGLYAGMPRVQVSLRKRAARRGEAVKRVPSIHGHVNLLWL
ncbi:hypothetical protein KM043_004891 [Ampulex compressa]|nr:hypothetical protein KM043_004891 [Ampulex compressa]